MITLCVQRVHVYIISYPYGARSWHELAPQLPAKRCVAHHPTRQRNHPGHRTLRRLHTSFRAPLECHLHIIRDDIFQRIQLLVRQNLSRAQGLQPRL